MTTRTRLQLAESQHPHDPFGSRRRAPTQPSASAWLILSNIDSAWKPMARFEGPLADAIKHAKNGYSGAVRVLSPCGRIEYERPADPPQLAEFTGYV